MASHKNIWKNVYQIGGSGYSDGSDCGIFIVDIGNRNSVLIDSGAGGSFRRLVENMVSAGLEPKLLKALILTHCHIDHIGSAASFKEQYGCKVIAHEADIEAIEGRDDIKTAAKWYGVKYAPVKVDDVIRGTRDRKRIGDVEFNFLHTPGHTPGSISVYCDISGKRVLFGQDIHGPFDASFGSNIEDWKISMKKLIGLKADILCEGHFGIFQPGDAVIRYIEDYLARY